MKTFPLAALVTVALVASGCLSGALQQGALPAGAPVHGAAIGVLANATKPTGALTAPTFKLLGMVAKGGPAYGAGEPSISAAMDGTLYISFPGCDQIFDAGVTQVTKLLPIPTCEQGVVYKSADGGASWKRLNKGDRGRLSDETPAANGDADITVDTAGSVYVSNLGAGIQTQRSDDGGATWSFTGNVVPKNDTGIDRNWLSAAGPGHVIHNWMGGNAEHPRAVSVRTTFDGGRNWTNATYLGKNIGWQGSVQFAPDGQTAYIPFTLAQGSADATSAKVYKLVVGKTENGGLNWTVLDTNVTIKTAVASFHFSGMILAPSLAITGDGHLAYVYAEEIPSPGAPIDDIGAIVKVITSADGGAGWSKPFVISKTPTAIFPWVSGGAGDRIGVSYFADNIPGDPDRTGLWDLHAGILDIGTDAPQYVDTLVQANVHVGGICGSGSVCLLTGADRSLLDYFENVVTPDGKLAIVYPSDPPQGGKYIEIRVAFQSGGSPMLTKG